MAAIAQPHTTASRYWPRIRKTFRRPRFWFAVVVMVPWAV